MSSQQIVNSVSSFHAAPCCVSRHSASATRSVSEKLIKLKETKGLVAPGKVGWNVKPCNIHTNKHTQTQSWSKSCMIYICIIPGCQAGWLLPWVMLGAGKKCGPVLGGCIWCKAARRGFLTAATHRQHAHIYGMAALVKPSSFKSINPHLN